MAIASAVPMVRPSRSRTKPITVAGVNCSRPTKRPPPPVAPSPWLPLSQSASWAISASLRCSIARARASAGSGAGVRPQAASANRGNSRRWRRLVMRRSGPRPERARQTTFLCPHRAGSLDGLFGRLDLGDLAVEAELAAAGRPVVDAALLEDHVLREVLRLVVVVGEIGRLAQAE